MGKRKFDDLVEVMHRLRRGCPWDREQTWESLRTYVLEEAYEVVDAIDQGAAEKIAEEAGDLLFQVVFLSEIGRERGLFDADDVIGHIHDKLVRRHPHVFGDVEVRDSRDVLRNWEAIKDAERADDAEAVTSALDDVPLALPALTRAEKLGSRAARAGFDWPDAEAVVDKLREEIDEVQRALADSDRDGVRREIGDLLFATAQLARFLELDPEQAGREAGRKFELRFRSMERALREQGTSVQDADMDELNRRWDQAKREHDEGGDRRD